MIRRAFIDCAGRRWAGALLALALAACGDTNVPADVDPVPDASDASSTSSDVSDAADSDAAASDAALDAALDTPPEVSAAPIAHLELPRYAYVDQDLVLDASGSTNASRYTWNLSDGRVLGPSDNPITTLRFDAEGRIRVTLTVHNERGERSRANGAVTITRPATFAPRRNGSIAVHSDGDRVAALSPDSDEVSVFAGLSSGELTLQARHTTCSGPRNLAWWGEELAISCPPVDRVEVRDPNGGEIVREIALPWGSRPFGLVVDARERLLVVLQGRQQLAVFEHHADAPAQYVTLGPDPRGVALLPGERAAITRWRSPEDGGQVAIVDLETLTLEAPVQLAHDDVPPSDTESGGIPTYLDHFVVSPNGQSAVVPALQANIRHGLYLGEGDLTHETTVRAVLAFVDLRDGSEDPDKRKRFNDRGLASSAVFSPYGDWLYVTMRGSRSVERVDAFNNAGSGAQLDIGFAPQDLALSPDGGLLLVDAYLSRELLVFDAHAFGSGAGPLQALPLASEEPLPEVILQGKRLFNDAFDTRLTQHSYVACAHCHLDGESDHLTWDFTGRGEGLRNTISLLGRAGTGHGPVHWSANFDEIQDFEHDIRGPFAGTGLMADEDFMRDGRDHPLGAPKAGVSEDLDALSAYVASLDTFPRSPHRAPDGALTPAAERGRALFESSALGCTTCHSGTAMTDSAMVDGVPILHDVGTIGEASGQRLGSALSGLDTPTLRAVWNSPPYLHDGSAPTLREAVQAGARHGVTDGLSESEWDDLTAYLLSLE